MSIRDYLKKNSNLWVIIFLMGLLSHGTMLLSKSIGIDTEDIITLQDLFYGGWLETGRQGLVLLKTVFGTQVFNPYFAGVMTLFFSTLACILWTYLFSYITGKENKAAIVIFAMLLLFSPIITEQFYFKLQAMEITIGFCLMAISLWLVYRAVETKKTVSSLGYIIVSVMINIILFSIYQTMVPLFMFGAGSCFSLHYFFPKDDTEDMKQMGKLIGMYVIAFLLGFVVNQLISMLFFSGSDYLASQVRWLTQSVKDCLINIYWHFRDVLLGKSIYYTKTFVIYCILVMVAAVLFLKSDKSKKGKALGLLGILFTLAAPFYMTVICGVTPVLRSQLVLPFTLAFLAYILFLFLENRRNLTYILIFLGLVTGYMQLKTTMQLNYTDSVRYESDVRMATSIMEEINKLEDETYSYPVVFVGKHPAELNNSCVKGDTIGYSFFEWDTDVEPYGFFSTRRILGFMHTLGGNYMQVTSEQLPIAIEHSKEMNSWPMQGSVEMKEGIIIIKLS